MHQMLNFPFEKGKKKKKKAQVLLYVSLICRMSYIQIHAFFSAYCTSKWVSDATFSVYCHFWHLNYEIKD